MTSDLDLLGQYARLNSEPAFAELVRRHVNLVYSAALRQVRSPQLAEEVAQSVVTDLARNAGKLKPDTILTAWLYQVARRTAVDVVRKESRRRLREQIAVEMTNMNATSADWMQIGPLLDDAMATLEETDRSAILLRYFENKTLREVGQTLGASEDAAQKRVSRAVERLREFFSKRKVTIGASGLVAIISANAVQAAPAGLAATISAAAAALAGTTITSTATASLFQIMTTTKIMAAIVITSLSIPLVILWHQNASLHRELASLLASEIKAQRSPGTSASSDQTGVANDESHRLRMEHLELLSLRGRVTQLSNELRQRTAKGTPPDANPASEPKDADSIIFTASLTNHVDSGQTLVVGGWSMKGMRGYLLVTPAILKGDDLTNDQPLTIQSQVVGAPESFWNQIGWTAAKSNTRRSTLASVLTSEQVDILLKALQETKDVILPKPMLVKRRNGQYSGLSYTQGKGVLMSIDLYPWIADDGQSVDLEIRPSAVSTKTPIDPILKPAGQPASP